MSAYTKPFKPTAFQLKCLQNAPRQEDDYAFPATARVKRAYETLHYHDLLEAVHRISKIEIRGGNRLTSFNLAYRLSEAGQTFLQENER